MASFTIRIGALLLVLGLGGYVLTGATSLTALIPAAVGVALVLFGLVAYRRPALRRHVMHAALLVAVLGLGGAVPGLIALPAALRTDGGVRPAMIMRASMSVILLVYLAVGIKSFVDARRARRA